MFLFIKKNGKASTANRLNFHLELNVVFCAATMDILFIGYFLKRITGSSGSKIYAFMKTPSPKTRPKFLHIISSWPPT